MHSIGKISPQGGVHTRDCVGRSVCSSAAALCCSPLAGMSDAPATSSRAATMEQDTVKLISRRPGRSGRTLKLSCACNAMLLLALLLAGWLLLPAGDESRARCSGHGMLFEDADACVCFECWAGPTCAERKPTFSAECVVDAGSGSPYMFESYWVRHPEARSSVLPSYHIGYGSLLPQLEASIRELHALVGNALTDGRHIVIGVGSTELIHAAIYALANESARSAVWSDTPYYSGYVNPARFFRTSLYDWLDSATPPAATAARPVIELVTSPNNPDGHLRTPRVAPGPHRKVVMDHAYLWPHFTPTSTPVNYTSDTIAL